MRRNDGARILAAMCVIALAGCASHRKTFQLAPDLYVFYGDEKGIVEGDLSPLRDRTLAAANAFAQDKGRDMVRITTHEAPVNFADFTTSSVFLRLAPPGSTNTVPPSQPATLPQGGTPPP